MHNDFMGMNLNNIPSEINEIFEKIKEEVQWLHIHWAYYKELFLGSKLRIDLMNESAPLFFYINQTLLLNEVILSVCKLTDPAQSSHDKENMSLDKVLQLIEKEKKNDDLVNKLKTVLAGIKSKKDPFKKHRDKRIAHKDMAVVMSTEGTIPDISVEMIDNILDEIIEYINTIEEYFNNSKTGYNCISISNDSNSLLGLLKYGFRYEELMASSKISHEDQAESKWYHS